ARPNASAGNPLLDVTNHLVRKLIDRSASDVRRMEHPAVPASRDHDPNSAHLRQTTQLRRIPPNPYRSHVHDRPTAVSSKLGELIDGRSLVVQDEHRLGEPSAAEALRHVGR